jgi:hypothetical protein
MELIPSLCYGYCSDCSLLKLNRNKEVQTATIEALIITDYCDLSLLVNLDTVRRALCSYVRRISWFIDQYKCVENYMDLLGATSSAVDGSPAEHNKGR